ncbi:D-(-)-3-hydroxybutyrate oligomer hydrolase [Kangiella shandongensis]|uniref:D-(-)-3-hydroxybutyrate oligomer hydrolase n=1 Tax=Kangiella shandongensis TaxID=2763258 RepID=UPI001CC07958|nr:D-(-)-3-hydroxybutyrate oligomer hydrolase [Kangiella shandongensis]
MKWQTYSTVTILAYTLAACSNHSATPDRAQQFETQDVITYKFSKKDNSHYDLLSAGLTIKQLRSTKPPELAKPDKPTPLELRQLAYYHNIRALVDLTAAGGFNSEYESIGNNPVYGTEYLTYSKNTDGSIAASYLIQIPDSFNKEQPCLITSASSGSRGVYGAVGVAGFWALSKGCAVAYTDKGTGTGFYLLDENKGYTIDGQLVSGSSDKMHFKTSSNTTNIQQGRIATKHAHSQINIEKDWASHVNRAAVAGLYFLNTHFPSQNYNSENTIIIGTGISNAGGAVLRAAEKDTTELFDAIVAGEPNITPQQATFVIEDKYGTVENHSQPLLDYNSTIAVYQGCALLSDEFKNHGFALYMQFNQAKLQSQCQFLKDNKLLSATTTQQQAKQAYQKLIENGLRPEGLQFLPVGGSINLWNAINTTYFNAYAKTPVDNPVCNSDFITDDMDHATQATLFSSSNGIPPTKGVKINWRPQLKEHAELSLVYQNDLCFAKTLNPGLPFDINVNTEHKAVIQQSIEQIKAQGNLKHKPTIIVHGQADGLIPVNHSSRAYVGLNYLKEGQYSKLKYYEIENAHHFDAFNALPQLQSSYIPLHYYYEQALELMWQHLTNGTPLPPSQLVKTNTRKVMEGKVETLTDSHSPNISSEPKHPITVDEKKVIIP